MKFDGKKFATAIENDVAEKARGKGIKIVSVLVGDDPASQLYTRLKKECADRIGIEFDIVTLPADADQDLITSTLDGRGGDTSVTGVMLQLPLPARTRKYQNDILRHINIDKDIDGLRWCDSGVMPATVRAVVSVLDAIVTSHQTLSQILKQGKYVVVGSKGSVGQPLVHFLRKRGVASLSEVDLDTSHSAAVIRAGDVVISCVGKPNLVTGDMVKPGLIALDVGISQINGHVSGDMTQDVYNAASVSVEVPGGVGPVTIACLMMNAYDMSVCGVR